jgi:hypothetical protein
MIPSVGSIHIFTSLFVKSGFSFQFFVTSSISMGIEVGAFMVGGLGQQVRPHQTKPLLSLG